MRGVASPRLQWSPWGARLLSHEDFLTNNQDQQRSGEEGITLALQRNLTAAGTTAKSSPHGEGQEPL